MPLAPAALGGLGVGLGGVAGYQKAAAEKQANPLALLRGGYSAAKALAPSGKVVGRSLGGAMVGGSAGSYAPGDSSAPAWGGAALGGLAGAFGASPRMAARMGAGAVRAPVSRVMNPAFGGLVAGGTADIGLGMMGYDTGGAFSAAGMIGSPVLRRFARGARVPGMPKPTTGGWGGYGAARPADAASGLAQNSRSMYEGMKDFGNAPFNAIGAAWKGTSAPLRNAAGQISTGTKAGLGATGLAAGVGIPNMMYESARNRAVEDADAYLQSRIPQVAQLAGSQAWRNAGQGLINSLGAPVDAAMSYMGMDPNRFSPKARAGIGVAAPIAATAFGVPWWLAGPAAMGAYGHYGSQG
jgi:hypothetical protein